MTRQLTIPPAHVWDRIEKILDEQDVAREHTNKLISNSFRNSRNINRFNFFLIVLMGAGLIALVIVNYSVNLKES